MAHLERLPVQHMNFQVEHGGPDPHRRQHLDGGEPPVGEQQLDSHEKHREGTDAQGSGASHRRERLSRRTASSTVLRSLSLMAAMSLPTCASRPSSAAGSAAETSGEFPSLVTAGCPSGAVSVLHEGNHDHAACFLIRAG